MVVDEQLHRSIWSSRWETEVLSHAFTSKVSTGAGGLGQSLGHKFQDLPPGHSFDFETHDPKTCLNPSVHYALYFTQSQEVRTHANHLTHTSERSTKSWITSRSWAVSFISAALRVVWMWPAWRAPLGGRVGVSVWRQKSVDHEYKVFIFE